MKLSIEELEPRNTPTPILMHWTGAQTEAPPPLQGYVWVTDSWHQDTQIHDTWYELPNPQNPPPVLPGTSPPINLHVVGQTLFTGLEAGGGQFKVIQVDWLYQTTLILPTVPNTPIPDVALACPPSNLGIDYFAADYSISSSDSPDRIVDVIVHSLIIEEM